MACAFQSGDHTKTTSMEAKEKISMKEPMGSLATIASAPPLLRVSLTTPSLRQFPLMSWSVLSKNMMMMLFSNSVGERGQDTDG